MPPRSRTTAVKTVGSGHIEKHLRVKPDLERFTNQFTAPGFRTPHCGALLPFPRPGRARAAQPPWCREWDTTAVPRRTPARLADARRPVGSGLPPCGPNRVSWLGE